MARDVNLLRKQQMATFISGVNFHNKGAELLLASAVQELSTWGPQYEPSVSWRCGTFTQRSGAGAATHVSIRQLPVSDVGLRVLPPRLRRQAKITIDQDINLILDASGFALGDQWGAAFAQRIVNRTRQWEQLGFPLIYLPQAFGPFEDETVARLSAEALEPARLICARDTESYRHLLKLPLSQDAKNRIVLYPDITIALKPGPPIPVPGDCPVIPNWNILERAPDATHRQKYMDSLLAAVAATKEQGFTPYGLSHEGARDTEILREIGVEVPGFEIVSDLSGAECKAIISRSRMIVSGRFHACVSALAADVPVIIHSWSHKYRELADEFGWGDFVVDPYKAGATADAVQRAVAYNGPPEVAENGARLREKVAEMWTIVRENSHQRI